MGSQGSARVSTHRYAKKAAFAGVSSIAVAMGLMAVSATSAAAQGTTASTLEEVVVTARKREENIQSTPVSVSAVSQETLENLNIKRLENLAQLAPSLKVTANGPSSVAPLIFLRGVGQVSVALYAEPPVGVYVDGVYFPRPTANALDLPDTEGVQVLRGPQGTLFGRNNTAGAILVTTESPKAEAGGKLNLGYGTENDFTASAVLHSGDIGDTGWRAKLVAQIHTRDGWIKFPGFNRNRWGGSLNQKAFSFTLEGNLAPSVKVSNRAFYGEVTAAVGWQLLDATAVTRAWGAQSVGLGGAPFEISKTPLDRQYRDPRIRDDSIIKSFGDALTVDWDLGEHLRFKSITAYSGLDENLTGQLTGNTMLQRVNRLGVTTIEPVMVHITPSEPGKTHQFSQEFQVSGDVGDFNYIGGFYYFREHNHERISTILATPPAVPTTPVTLTESDVIYTVATEAMAGYAQVGWKPASLGEKFELNVGVRYTTDHRGVDTRRLSRPSTTGIQTQTAFQNAQADFENVGWSVSASYQVNDDLFVFARAASAFRAGGFNAGGPGAPVYQPETAISYEAGFKSEWLDKRVRLNATAFTANYEDLQINQACPACGPGGTFTNFIVNAGSAKYTGYELEAIGILGGGFQVDANYGYVFPKYEEFLVGNGLGGFTNIAGQARFAFLSKHTWHVGAQWSSPTPVGNLIARTDYSYKSAFIFSTNDATSTLGRFQSSGIERNLSARLILTEIPINNDRIHLKAQIFGENLTDSRHLVTAVDFGSVLTGIFARPRSFGIGLTAEF